MIYHKTYPTGRKHCSICRRWRHVLDFGVRRWLDDRKTVPVTFASACNVCHARKARPPGTPPREITFKTYRPEYWTAKKKEDWRRMKADPVRLAEHNEYHRFWWEAKRRKEGKPAIPSKGPKVTLVVTAEGAVDLTTGKRYVSRTRQRDPVS